MTQRSEFVEFVKQKMEELIATLEKKGKEYAINGSAFDNFEQGLALSTCKSREEYAWNLRVKHLQSVKDIITNSMYTNQPLIDEKLGDDILYGFLLWGMMTDNVQNVRVATIGQFEFDKADKPNI